MAGKARKQLVLRGSPMRTGQTLTKPIGAANTRRSTMDNSIAEGLKLYPNKDLRKPVREYQSTVFELVKRTFAVRKHLESKNG
jgi:hypothetical protein